MKMNKMYFVKTSDKETAEKLRKEGFQELPMEDGRYVFINMGSTANFENKNVEYTNKLCL